MDRWLRRSLICCLWLVVAGCSDNANLSPTKGVDAGADAHGAQDAGPTDAGASDADAEDAVDRSPPALVGDANVDAQLRRPVTVRTDAFGMRHVRAESLEDLFFINGFLYATDRFGQMEFYRRVASGTLAEIYGEQSGDVVRLDALMRAFGLKREAEEHLRRNFDENAQEYRALMAYCRGVNAWIAQYRLGSVQAPGGVPGIMPAASVPDWQPADVMALSRLLALQWSYQVPTWVEFQALRQAALDTFSADAADPQLARRHGFLADVLRFAPATEATHIDGFPTSGSRALEAGGAPTTRSFALESPHVGPDILTNALAVHRGIQDLEGAADFDLFGRRNLLGVGANSWVLGGAHTESGYPTVAHDVHLPLSLPTPFYPIHLELADDVDGRAPLKLVGAALMGLPGVQVGRSDRVAWGVSASRYDVSDVYLEEMSGAADAEAPATARYFQRQVAVARRVESLGIGRAGEISRTLEVPVEVVPHHGPILPTLVDGEPSARRAAQALSVRWTGFEAGNDLGFWLRLWRAGTPAEAEVALNHYPVGLGSFVFGFSSGETFYTGQADIPLRQRGALDFDAVDNPSGNAPVFVLPGSGGADWDGWLDERRIPHAYNPAAGYVVAADNDPLGVTLNNQPFGAQYYVGGFFDMGLRAARITEAIESQIERDVPMSVAQQVARMHERGDLLAARLVPEIVNGVDVLLEASMLGSDDPEVLALLGEVRSWIDELEALRDLLDVWDFESPGSVAPGGGDGYEAERSAAAALFNAAMVYILDAVFADELGALSLPDSADFAAIRSPQVLARALIYLLEGGSALQSFDLAAQESSIFDDLGTPELVETRVTIFVRALMQARARFNASEPLGTALGRAIPSPRSVDPQKWVWGKMHGLWLAPLLAGSDAALQRPAEHEAQPLLEVPGAGFSVSGCAYDLRDYDFGCTSGAALRMVHVMDPAQPRTYLSLPGGYVMDPQSPHFVSELPGWQRGELRGVEDRHAQLEAQGAVLLVFGAD